MGAKSNFTSTLGIPATALTYLNGFADVDCRILSDRRMNIRLGPSGVTIGENAHFVCLFDPSVGATYVDAASFDPF